MLEKGFELVPSKRGSIVAFDLSLLLLLTEINPVAEKQSRKRYALRICGTGRIQIILALPIEVVALYVGTSIIQDGIPGLDGSIPGGGICLAIFLTLNKRF